MTIINTSPDRTIQIGYEGEDKVTILRFSYSDKWLENGEGIFTVRVLRNGESQAYNAQVIQDDREDYTIDMTVTDVELSKKGYGEMQLVYTGADFVKKSPVYKYYVSRSVDDAVDPPAQDVYTQIIETLSDFDVEIGNIENSIGSLDNLATVDNTSLVNAINEVYERGEGSSVTVDDALSNVSENPVQNKVITSRIISAESAIASAQTAIQGKADIQTVSALSDAVNGLDSDVLGLQTGKADTSTVTALSGTVSGLQTAVQGKADTATVTALSGTVTGLQTSKADKSYVDTQLAEKASAQTVSDLSDDVSDLQTAIQGKADMATVTALSGTVSSLQTTVQSKADAQTVTTLSGTVSSLQTSKADKSYVDTQLAAKASTATATTSTNGLMSAQDKSKLDAVYADYTSALTALGGGS